MNIKITATVKLLMATAALAVCPLVIGQEVASEEKWFGIELPPVFVPHVSPVSTSEHEPAPAVVPVGEESYRELEGARLAYDLECSARASTKSSLWWVSPSLGVPQAVAAASGGCRRSSTLRKRLRR